MTVDPEFPDRPQHPDFWAMSRAVVSIDKEVDGGKTVEQVLNEARIDTDSLVYMARQRALRMAQAFPNPDAELLARLASVWIDAFLAGLAVGDERAVTQVLEKGSDGNRRQGVE